MGEEIKGKKMREREREEIKRRKEEMRKEKKINKPHTSPPTMGLRSATAFCMFGKSTNCGFVLESKSSSNNLYLESYL